MTDVNRQFLLKSRPSGLIKPSDFDWVRSKIPEPGAGQALIRTLYLSLDPTNRIWMSDADQYMPPVRLGEVMRGVGLGQVVRSLSAAFKPGDIVSGLVGWQDYSLAGQDTNAMLSVLPPVQVPLTVMLGACGVTGCTAYFGLLEIGKPQPDETVVVSAAAGAVGSVVGQIAKMKGCRVVGIAGGVEKCRYLIDELGFDAAVDYRRPDWRENLVAATPEGVDINFENVGGEIMEGVMQRMNNFGRMPLCGMISNYNSGVAMRAAFDPILMRRIHVQGFIVTDFFQQFGTAIEQLSAWVLAGRIRHIETLVEGLEQAPLAINRLFDGSTRGKLVVRVNPNT